MTFNLQWHFGRLPRGPVIFKIGSNIVIIKLWVSWKNFSIKTYDFDYMFYSIWIQLVEFYLFNLNPILRKFHMRFRLSLQVLLIPCVPIWMTPVLCPSHLVLLRLDSGDETFSRLHLEVERGSVFQGPPSTPLPVGWSSISLIVGSKLRSIHWNPFSEREIPDTKGSLSLLYLSIFGKYWDPLTKVNYSCLHFSIIGTKITSFYNFVFLIFCLLSFDTNLDLSW